jgi:endo-1,4-beta-xylanase
MLSKLATFRTSNALALVLMAIILGLTLLALSQAGSPGQAGSRATESPSTGGTTPPTLVTVGPANNETSVAVPRNVENGASSKAMNACVQLGTAVRVQPLRDDKRYRKTLRKGEFELLTPEDAMKFNALRPSRDLYNFQGADAIVNFAEDNDMEIRGHTLVWHKALPGWLEEGHYTRDELKAILREHITTVVENYRGRVAAWDVVNEAVDTDGTLRDTIWLRGIGPEYIEMAFRWAHEADPQAELFYNDYGGEDLGRKSDAIYALARNLREREVPIHGVGLQMHVSVGHHPDPQDLSENMARLADLGLEVDITEMDVQLQDGAGTMEEKLAAQADVYGDMAGVCRTSGTCKRFITWGFTDRYSWIRESINEQERPLLLTESYQPKPAYYAVMEGLECLAPHHNAHRLTSIQH